MYAKMETIAIIYSTYYDMPKNKWSMTRAYDVTESHKK